jgi:hypothetical protein
MPDFLKSLASWAPDSGAHSEPRTVTAASRRGLHVAGVVPDDVALDEDLAPDAYDSRAGANVLAQRVQSIAWNEREELSAARDDGPARRPTSFRGRLKLRGKDAGRTQTSCATTPSSSSS